MIIERNTKRQRLQKRQQNNSEWQQIRKTSDSLIDLNPCHALYYKQQLALNEYEWNQFRTIIATSLPVCVRLSDDCITTMNNFVNWKLNQLITSESSSNLKNIELTRFAWCPYVWQLNVDSQTLAKDVCLHHLSQFLNREIELGNIVRQELVSMLPVKLLNIQPNSIVLDMCAAPGSKAQQILSKLDQEQGVLVANDSDPKRIKTLIHRLLLRGYKNLIINCQDAQDLISFYGSQSSSHSSLFDRILCDVPCSGDGTFRKAPHLWRLFRPRTALELHPIQLSIAMTGFQLLKPGGRMVYSTCSLNPIEDEAVIHALIQKFGPLIKLVNVKAEGLIEGVIWRCGLVTWSCDENIFSIGEDSELKRKECQAKLPPLLSSMYPPNSTFASSTSSDHDLKRCIRIMPQDQNTGGFFIVVFEKSSEIEAWNQINSLSSHRNAIKSDRKVDTNEKGFQMESLQIINSKKRKKELNGFDAMKRLGYNPKCIQVESHGLHEDVEHPTTSIGQMNIKYSHVMVHNQQGIGWLNLKYEEMNSLERKAFSDRIVPMNDPDTETARMCLMIRRAINSVEKMTEPSDDVVLVSTRVVDCLKEWSKQIKVYQIGVPVASLNSFQHNFEMNWKGIDHLYPYIQPSKRSGLKVGIKDFLYLLRIGNHIKISKSYDKDTKDTILGSLSDNTIQTLFDLMEDKHCSGFPLKMNLCFIELDSTLHGNDAIGLETKSSQRLSKAERKLLKKGKLDRKVDFIGKETNMNKQVEMFDSRFWLTALILVVDGFESIKGDGLELEIVMSKAKRDSYLDLLLYLYNDGRTLNKN